MENGYIYIIRREDGLIKIGRSINPVRRARTLETQGGFIAKNIFFSKECSNSSNIENEMHKIFNNKRIIGEWFDIDFNVAVETLKLLDFKNPYIKEEIENDINKANVFAKQLVSNFFAKGYEEIETVFNLDKWQPTENDIKKAKEDIENYIKFCIEECEEYKWADEAKEKLYIIEKSNDFKKIKETIQDYYTEEFYSVELEDLRKCFGNDKTDFIEKVLGIKYEKVNHVKEFLINS